MPEAQGNLRLEKTNNELNAVHQILIFILPFFSFPKICCTIITPQRKNKKKLEPNIVMGVMSMMSLFLTTTTCVGSYLGLTVSKDAEARRSGRKPTSNNWSRKLWSSMPYTRSRKSTMGALWSGQKQADMSGSVTVPSEG